MPGKGGRAAEAKYELIQQQTEIDRKAQAKWRKDRINELISRGWFSLITEANVMMMTRYLPMKETARMACTAKAFFNDLKDILNAEKAAEMSDQEKQYLEADGNGLEHERTRFGDEWTDSYGETESEYDSDGQTPPGKGDDWSARG